MSSRPHGLRTAPTSLRFATAIDALKAQGLRFMRLPDRFNCRWRHPPALAEPCELVVFHMTSSFFYGTDLEEKNSTRRRGVIRKAVLTLR